MLQLKKNQGAEIVEINQVISPSLDFLQSGDTISILKKGKVIEGYSVVYVGNFESAQEALNIISLKNCQDSCYSLDEIFDSNANNKKILQNLATENGFKKKKTKI